jgi:hypothetical protein
MHSLHIAHIRNCEKEHEIAENEKRHLIIALGKTKRAAQNETSKY